MVTLICKIEIRIFDSTSLKDKRSVLKSILEKLKNKNNISVIECDYQDFWQKSKIGICFCSLNSVDAHKKLENILVSIELNPYVEIIDVEREDIHD